LGFLRLLISYFHEEDIKVEDVHFSVKCSFYLSDRDGRPITLLFRERTGKKDEGKIIALKENEMVEVQSHLGVFNLFSAVNPKKGK
jgi:hypothetical protein